MLQQAEKIYDLIVQIIQIFRYGRKEKVLLVFAVVLGAMGKWIVTPDLIPISAKVVSYVSYVVCLVALVLLIAAVVRIWKQAIPPKKDTEPDVQKPAAIKGPMTFGIQDGELFAQLGRKTERDKLLGYILDDQIPLVVVMGESGTGKTSLLRAGLEFTLARGGASEPVVPIYWEAFPSDPVAGLLRALQLKWGREDEAKGEDGSSTKDGAQPFPATLDDLLAYDATPRRVVILDQAEQLSPERHRDLFDVLRRVVERPPPHQVTWVIAFRREYAATWLDFESAIVGFFPPRLSLKRFSIDEAVAVMATLAHEGGVQANQDVIRRIAGSIAQDGKVSPVDIGISLLVLSELAGRPDVAIDDALYQAAGEEAGLLALYVKNRMARLPDYEHDPMMLALLHLIDPETDQRVAEGRAVAALAEASGLPAQRLENHLDYFASRNVRLLERLPAEARQVAYRLAHERLIPALRQLAGVLTAQATQAERLLNDRFRVWRSEAKARWLLTLGELRRVLKFQDQFRWGRDQHEKIDYIRRSKNRRIGLYGLAGFLVVLSLAGLFALNTVLTAERHRHDFRQWGLPADLYDRLDQLNTLAVTGLNITNHNWLREGIDSLSLRLTNIDDRAFSTTLTALTLDLRYSQISSVPDLPSGLTTLTLDVGGSQISGVPDLPSGLTTLTLDVGFPQISSLPDLPSGLTTLTLDVGDSQISRVPDLPSGLTTLTLDVGDASQISSLPNLPSGLTTLTLYVAFPQIRSLPDLNLPSGLTTLTLDLRRSRISSLPNLPPGLQRLELSSKRGQISTIDRLPTSVNALSLSYH